MTLRNITFQFLFGSCGHYSENEVGACLAQTLIKQGHPEEDAQVASEGLQGKDSTASLGNPCQYSITHTQRREFTDIQVFNCLLLLVLSLDITERSLAAFSLHVSFRYLYKLITSPLKLMFFRLKILNSHHLRALHTGLFPAVPYLSVFH